MNGVAFPSDHLVSCLDQCIAAQHGIFIIKMVRDWNFAVKSQGTLLRAVASSAPSLKKKKKKSAADSMIENVD